MRASLILKILGKLVDVNPLLAFKVFEAKSHTGFVIKVWKEKECAAWRLDAKASISLWTEDGASNNLKSSKLLDYFSNFLRFFNNGASFEKAKV